MRGRTIVAWNVRRLRIARGISQDDLALIAGVERAYVGYLERGKRNPTVDTLEKLSEALVCQMAELFSAIDEGVPTIKPLKPGRKPVKST